MIEGNGLWWGISERGKDISRVRGNGMGKRDVQVTDFGARPKEVAETCLMILKGEHLSVIDAPDRLHRLGDRGTIVHSTTPRMHRAASMRWLHLEYRKAIAPMKT